MYDDKSCTKADLAAYAQSGSSPYSVTVSHAVENAGLCYVSVSYQCNPSLPFVTTRIDLPGMDPIGPLWDGTMTETAVAKVDGKTGFGTLGVAL